MVESLKHQPVLAEELIYLLGLKKFAHSKRRGKLIDATFGLGGYELLMSDFNLDILGIEIDNQSFELAKKKFSELPKKSFQLRLVRGNFRDIDYLAGKFGFTEVDAIIFDLGISSFQLARPELGLSFQYPQSPLDMRLDRKEAVTAADLLNLLDQKKLEIILEKVLSYRSAAKLSGLIVKRRKEKPFSKVSDLLSVLEDAHLEKNGKINPATKVFLALRMAVNSELENLEVALPKAFSLLRREGKMAVVSFHSGEDRLVKDFFRQKGKEGNGRVLTPKPIRPSEKEVFLNPRSRSAKLRVIEKK